MNEAATAPSLDARNLMARIDPDRPRPELTAAIAACECPEEARAGLYLLNGDWDAAHRTAQDLDSIAGAYWHALVHRHEPDFGNSKYWLRRVGASPVHEALVAAAREAGQAGSVLTDGRWDPARFTDRFAAPADAAETAWTRALDRLEMHTLLELSLTGQSVR